MDSSKKFDNPSPELNANIFSKLTFTWLLGLFRKGLHNDLEVKDLYNTKTKDLSEPLGDELERNWNKEIARAKKKQREPKLLTAIIHTFKRAYIFHGVILFIQSVFIRTAQPVVLSKLIAYFNGDKQTVSEAYCLATGLVLLTICSTSLEFHAHFGLIRLGMRSRIACCSLMYRKMLRLSRTAHGETATGQVVNLMSNDVSRFDQTPTYLHYLWIMPIQAVVMTYFMYETVGLAAFAGVAVITIQAVPLQGYLSRWTAHLRLRIAQRTDERVRLMNEIISGIQVIKMYAWEKPFQEVVRLARKLEIDVLSTTSYIRGFSLALMVYTERLSLYVTIVTYVLLGNELSGDKVFSMAQFFNIMQLFMAIFFPLAVSMGGEALVSVKRIEDFLLQEENVKLVKPILQNGYTDKEKDGSISIKNGFAAWKPNQIVETLLDLNLNLKSGQLCAIVGQVGAGKSSILHLLLSELPLSAGSLYVGGTVSYCSQEPWLFASTVRNNILFGQPFEKQRYNEVVRACALLKDFEQFPHGDKTLVGDRGASLSGGQRARINLARAVYRRADIYLMDDPLSAVDTHVSKHLFEECMKEYLSTKTRILVTHQLQFIKEADVILVINNGRIEKQGTWSELSANGNTFEGIIHHNDEEQAPEEEIIPTRQRLMSELSAHSASPEDEEDDPQETQELMEKGAMSSKVFFQYLRAGGSIYLLGFLLLSLIVAQIASSGADYWIRYWTNQVDEMKKNNPIDNVPDFSNLNNEFHNNETTDFPENVTKLINSISEIITTSPLITDITESILDMTSEDPLKTKRSLDISTISNATKNISVTVPHRSKREIDNNILNSTTPLPLQYENANQQYFSQEMCIYIYSFCIAGSVILTTMRSLVFYKVIMNASINLHNTMFSNIIQSVMRFFDTNPSGRILNRFSKDMGAIDELLPRALLEAIQIFLVMSGILTLVALVNPYLILPMIVMGVLFYIIRVVYLATAQDIKRLEGITKSPVFSHLSASMDGLITIRSCGAEELLQKEFDSHQDLHTSAWYLTVATSTAFGFFLDCVSIAFMACVTFSFIIFNNDDDTPSGNVGLAISQSMILTGMLQYGMRQTAEVLNQMTSVERVLQYTRLEKEGPFESLPGKKPPLTWPQQGKIIFEHLYLRYCPTDPPVLKDLNIQIQPGSKVGIVGRTGAGKSSLIQALFKLAPLDGKIYLDEVATDSIGLKDLRTKISIIPQQPVLFSATLRHNLDPFESCDDASLWQALEEVELKEVAENLDYKVNEGGSNFSAGQRQLLCLARAIVRNNKVLVLDEATANVDPNTDALIQKTIRKKFASCTVLTIAHRLNTVMDSDKILVMDAGQMVEYDHPHLLLQTPDSYLSKMVAETGKNMEQKLRRIAEEAYLNKEALINEQNSIQE